MAFAHDRCPALEETGVDECQITSFCSALTLCVVDGASITISCHKRFRLSDG